MRGEYIYQQAQRAFEEPEDLDDIPLQLPEIWVCPDCGKDLAWDGVNDTLSWCETPGCKYDNGISVDANRERWRIENGL